MRLQELSLSLKSARLHQSLHRQREAGTLMVKLKKKNLKAWVSNENSDRPLTIQQREQAPP